MTFTRDLQDIFTVQDEIAGRVTRALRLRRRSGAGEKLAAAVPNSPFYQALLGGPMDAPEMKEAISSNGLRWMSGTLASAAG